MGSKLFSKSDFSVIKFAWELGYTIAIPLVTLAFLGRFLDKKFGTSPFLLLAGIFLSILISSIGVYRKTTSILKNLGNEIRNQKTKGKPKIKSF